MTDEQREGPDCMDWERIRTHYAHLFETSGLTQEAVATAAELPGQNVISKLLANEHRGPSVETFVKAVRGLGLTMSAFFALLEGHDPALASSSVLDRLRTLELALGAAPSSPAASAGRLVNESSSTGRAVSDPAASRRIGAVASEHRASNIVNIHSMDDAAADRFERFVQAQFDALVGELRRAAADLGATLEARGRVHPREPRARARARRRVRKTA